MTTERSPEVIAAYEEERERWIEEHGSRRLRVAAERGYKHDGIYREERAAVDLPGFRALPKADVRDVVNPTEEGLDLESQALEHGIGNVRLVWVADTGTDLPDGEYVQVSDYLCKHTLYLPVGEEDPDA